MQFILECRFFLIKASCLLKYMCIYLEIICCKPSETGIRLKTFLWQTVKPRYAAFHSGYTVIAKTK